MFQNLLCSVTEKHRGLAEGCLVIDFVEEDAGGFGGDEKDSDPIFPLRPICVPSE